MASRITRKRRLLVAVSALVASAGGLSGCGSDGAVFPFQTAPPNTVPPGSWVVVEGRPLRRRGRLLVGRSRCRSRSVLRLAIPGVDNRRRAALAAHWRRLAELEHASIVAFEVLGHQLTALDAPAELIDRCGRAARQEADHAARCFALASRYEGATVVPGRIRAPGHEPVSLVQVATESLRDGVLNEGYAAWLADQQLIFARDPDVIDTLRAIARDEAEHADLAWRILLWCASVGGEPVRRALLVEALVLPVMVQRTCEHTGPSDRDGTLAAHGLAVVDHDGAGCAALRSAIVRRLIETLPTTIAGQSSSRSSSWSSWSVAVDPPHAAAS